MCRLDFYLSPEYEHTAGQLMEVERLRDYQIIPLILYQSGENGEPPRVTAMLRALLASLGFEPKAYSMMDELATLVHNYLSARG